MLSPMTGATVMGEAPKIVQARAKITSEATPFWSNACALTSQSVPLSSHGVLFYGNWKKPAIDKITYLPGACHIHYERLNQLARQKSGDEDSPAAQNDEYTPTSQVYVKRYQSHEADVVSQNDGLRRSMIAVWHSQMSLIS